MRAESMIAKTIARVTALPAPVAALMCLLVALPLLTVPALATVCDPDNTTGDCSDGDVCHSNDACSSNACVFGICAPSCSDGIQDGNETDVDCGGPDCDPCSDGQFCNSNADCINSCDSSFTCCNSTGTSSVCGANCTDLCAAGETCTSNSDCANSLCVNGTCGGSPVCDPDNTTGDCSDGEICSSNAACSSNLCYGTCASCSNNILDGDESDIDCGGTDCSPCSDGFFCFGDSDCSSLLCVNNS